SVDENKKAWLKAIRKDKISWIQVNDNSGRESKIAADWSVYAIPTSYLIGRDGKLIAMDLSSKELEKTLKKILE
ncbi:MAG: AhpC/TSA family protein, partial [Chitinophagaceae bacterium]|nr:AhpC/TSA family protein [Chitinophagaceae bacterium]